MKITSKYLLISISKSKVILGIALSIIVLAGASDCDAQTEYEDVVYLKNGEIRRGIIIEEIPLKQIKIKTRDGNVFVYGYDEIERKTKEERLHVRPRYRPTPEHHNRKSPGAALGLSAIGGFFSLNGGGQLYNGEIGKGILFFSTGLFSAIWFVTESNKNPYYEQSDPGVPAIIVLVNYVWGMVDAYKSAKRINKRDVFTISPSNSNVSFIPTLIGNKSPGLVTTVSF